MQVINYYLWLAVERSEQREQREKRALPRCYAFSTFFYTKLSSDGFAGVSRWTRRLDLFTFDLVFVPVHLAVHWCLAVCFLTYSIIPLLNCGFCP